MVEAGVTDVAMEVSSHALALGRVAGTRFAVAAFTNLSQDHLDFHRRHGGLLRGQGRAVRRARPARRDLRRRRVGRRLAARTPDAVTVSTRGAGRLARGRRRDRARRHAVVHRARPGRRGRCRSGCCCPGPSTWPTRWSRWPAWTRSGCRPRWPPAGSRTSRCRAGCSGWRSGQPFLAVVDYAHKPAAVAALLDTLRAQVPGRLIVVLGCGGDRDRGKRPLMGAAAAARAELLVVTDDNPRTRGPGRHPGRDAGRSPRRAGPRRGPRDRRPAGGHRGRGRHGRGPATPSSSRARGTRPGQEIHGVRHPFDDAAELAAAIAALRPLSRSGSGTR